MSLIINAWKFFMSGIKFPVKVRSTHKIEWKNQSTLVFFVIKVRKSIQSICQKNIEKKNILISYW